MLGENLVIFALDLKLDWATVTLVSYEVINEIFDAFFSGLMNNSSTAACPFF